MDEVAIDSSSGQQPDEGDQDGVDKVVPAKKKLKAAKIDHTYRDYSQRTIPPLANSSGTAAISSRSKTARSVNRDGHEEVSPKKKQTRETFPATLHKILCRPEYRHIICWMPHGRSWTVVDKDLLAREVCPTYFAHDKFESFNRSVNGWGFKRLLREGPDNRSYYHECFLRGRPELASLIARLENPGKRLPDKDGEPDFYDETKYKPLPPDPVLNIPSCQQHHSHGHLPPSYQHQPPIAHSYNPSVAHSRANLRLSKPSKGNDQQYHPHYEQPQSHLSSLNNHYYALNNPSSCQPHHSHGHLPPLYQHHPPIAHSYNPSVAHSRTNLRVSKPSEGNDEQYHPHYEQPQSHLSSLNNHYYAHHYQPLGMQGKAFTFPPNYHHPHHQYPPSPYYYPQQQQQFRDAMMISEKRNDGTLIPPSLRAHDDRHSHENFCVYSEQKRMPNDTSMSRRPPRLPGDMNNSKGHDYIEVSVDERRGGSYSPRREDFEHSDKTLGSKYDDDIVVEDERKCPAHQYEQWKGSTTTNTRNLRGDKKGSNNPKRENTRYDADAAHDRTLLMDDTIEADDRKPPARHDINSSHYRMMQGRHLHVDTATTISSSIPVSHFSNHDDHIHNKSSTNMSEKDSTNNHPAFMPPMSKMRRRSSNGQIMLEHLLCDEDTTSSSSFPVNHTSKNDCNKSSNTSDHYSTNDHPAFIPPVANIKRHSFSPRVLTAKPHQSHDAESPTCDSECIN